MPIKFSPFPGTTNDIVADDSKTTVIKGSGASFSPFPKGKSSEVRIDPVVEKIETTPPPKNAIGFGDVVKGILNTVFNPMSSPILNAQKNIETLSAPVLKEASKIPAVRQTLEAIAKTTENVPLKAISAVEALSPEKTYQEAYEIWEKKSQDPNSPIWQKFFFGVQSAVPQTGLGVALSFIPYAGAPLSYAYWTSLSANEQIRQKGEVSSITNVAIDVVGDRMLGGAIESLLRASAKSLRSAVLRGFTVEGGTEVAQDLLKMGNDYKNAKSEAERLAAIERAKNYFTSGDILVTLGVGGVSGGAITGAGVGIQKMTPGEIQIEDAPEETLDFTSEPPPVYEEGIPYPVNRPIPFTISEKGERYLLIEKLKERGIIGMHFEQMPIEQLQREVTKYTGEQFEKRQDSINEKDFDIPKEFQQKAEADWSDNYADRYGDLAKKEGDLTNRIKAAKTADKVVLNRELTKVISQMAAMENEFVGKWQSEKEETAETLSKQIEKKIEKFRKEADLMASREGAGVRLYSSDQTGGENRVYSYFKKSRAGADMAKRKEAAQNYASQLLYENDPEFKELVDKRDNLVEDKLNLPADELSEEYLTSLFSEISDEEAKINEANEEFGQAGPVEEDQGEGGKEATGEKAKEIAEQYGNKKLIPELRGLEQEAIEYAAANEEQIIADYLKENGNVLMGDAIKEFLPKYQQNRDKYVAYKAASNYLWHKIFDKFLAENKNVGNGAVSIVMGGQGSGKTASLKSAFEINPIKGSSFSIESLMADEQISKKTLNRLIENGYDVDIYHIASKAVDAYKRVIKRAIASGRVVPIEYFVTGHQGAKKGGMRLSKDTGSDKVQYFLIDNRVVGSPAQLVEAKSEELAVLEDLGYNENEVDSIKKELYEYTKELYNKNEISEEIFKGQTNYYERGVTPAGDTGSEKPGSRTEQISERGEGNPVDLNSKEKQPPTKEEGGFVLPEKEGDDQALQGKKWQLDMAKEPATPKTVDKTTIMTWVEKTFGVPLKGKATHKWKASGMYYPTKQIIRMQKWGELSVLTHEVAHHIDKLLKNSTQLGHKWRNKNRIIVKELADLDYDQKYRRTSEGFAEYMRHKMTTGLEKEKAPAFDKFFSEEFLAKQPELKGKLDKMKELMDTWNQQGAENRIIKQIDWKQEHTKLKGFMPKIKKAWGFLQEKFNDEFYTPQRIVGEIQRTIGRKLKPTENPAIMMEYSKSKAGAVARTFVMDKAIDEYGNVIGPGLVEILKPIPNSEMKQFIAYAVSKRAINLENRGVESGIDIDDAKYLVEKYSDKGWDTQAGELTQWSNNLLGWLIRAGGLKGEVATRMRDLNPVYLPFKRAFLDEAGVFKGGAGFVDTGSGMKGIKGSGRPIINPIESMIAQSRELITKAQKIRIAKIFADLSKEENIGGFITKVPAPMKATTFEASQINDYILKTTGQLPDAGVNDFLTVFTQDFKYNGKENIVTIWQDGKQEFYEIHPDLYEAFKGIDPLKLGPVARVLAPFSRMLRLGATGLKFSFGLVRNPFRDAFTYVVFSKRMGATVFDPIKGIYTDLTTKEGEATWRFKKLGGALSGQIGFDRAATQSTYDELLLEKLGKKGKVLKIVKHPVNTLRDLLSVTEMGPRSAELEANYKKYLAENKDWSEEDAFVQAFNDAQDVTVNFTKSGKWAKQINEVTAFFNVAIRGPEKTYRVFRERPIQATVKGILWLTLMALGSWWQNKDKDWYRNLPPAYKYNNLFFEIGDTVFRLPIPFELGMIFMSAPLAMLDTFQDPDVKWMKGVLDIAKSQIPDPTPSAFRGAIDVMTNKNYLGLPIESEGMQYLYPTERKRDYTSKFAIITSKVLDKINIHLSPIQLDYLLDSYSGGFLRQFRVSSDELSGLPVIGDLMLKDKDYPRRQLNEFFADYEYLTQKKQAGVASDEELEKLSEIKDFYKYYSDVSDNLKEAKKEKNQEDVKEYILQMRDTLKEYGYD